MSVIKHLRRKLNLLIEYGHAASLEDIARQIGKPKNTVLSWADDERARIPGTIPKASAAIVESLFRDCLGGDIPPERLDAIFEGPASRLEDHLRAARSPMLGTLAQREGRSDHCRFVRKSKSDTGLVETTLDEKDDDPEHVIKLGEYFRLIIERDLRSSHVIALQHANWRWGFVPCALDQGSGFGLLPGIMSDGSIAWMSEHEDKGINSFTVLVCPEAFAEDISRLRGGGQVAGGFVLQRIVAHYLAQPKDRRHIHTIAVKVE